MSAFRIVLSFVFLAFVGLFLAPRLPVDLNPSKQEPVLTVSFDLPEASPLRIEQEVTAPLENILSQISQIKQIYSTSNYHQGTIEITFDRTVDFEFKKFQVASAIRQIYPKLNPNVSYPQLAQRKRQDEGERVLLLYRVSAPLQTYQIRETVENIFLSTLSQIPDVGRVEVTGATGLQVVVEFDPQRLRTFNLSAEQLAAFFERRFGNQIVGAADSRAGKGTLVKLSVPSTSLTELEALPVVAHFGSVPLRSLANIYPEEIRPSQLLRINGKNAVALAVYADQKVNRLALAAAISNRVETLQGLLPAGYRLIAAYDDTGFLRTELQKTYARSALSAFILVFFILFVYRRVQQILLLLAGVLITFCLTALGSYFLGLRIHLYSIAGLTIAFGILLDNLIMVLDSLDHPKRENVNRSVIGAAFCSILCLSVLFFLPPEERENLAEFGMSVILAIAVSVLVAIFFVPAARRLLPWQVRSRGTRAKRLLARARMGYQRLILSLAKRKKILLATGFLAFGTPVFLLPASWPGHPWYNETIGSDWYQENVRPVVDPLLGGALRAFVRNVFERGGFRSPEKTRLMVQATLPYGQTLDDMDRVMTGMESYLAQFKGIDQFVTHIYSGQFAQIEITFSKNSTDNAFPFQLKGRLIAQSLDWGGVEWNVFGVGRGFSSSSAESLPNFKVQLKGYNYETLEQQAALLARELLNHKRIQKVNTNERLSWFEKNTDEWVLAFPNLYTHELRPREALSQLNEATGVTRSAPALWIDGKQTPLIVRGRESSNHSVFALTHWYIPQDSGSVTLAPYVTIGKRTTLNAIHKDNRQYLRQVGFDYYGSYQFGNKYLDETLEKFRTTLPPGYTAEKSTWMFDWKKIKRNYLLLAVLLALVYLVSAAMFEQFATPALIAGSIPFSFIGIFSVFGWGGFYFDQGGYAAFVLQASLAVASSVYIANAILHHRATPMQGVSKAVSAKVKPVSLSILSTCAGLLPFVALGDQEVFWFALAIGTMGGMAATAVFVFVVIPVFMVINPNQRTRTQLPSKGK